MVGALTAVRAGLHVELRLRLGDLALDVALEVADGEVVALLGPNGAGKTTTLRALAGLQPIDEGRIVLADREGSELVLDDPAKGTFVPPERRPVGVVFQDGLLFPRLGALDNVAFGLRARGVRKRRARAEASRWLDEVDMGGAAWRRPAELSGGEAQRVALARALAVRPRLLLLDEPLAALDAHQRTELRRRLRRHLGTFEGARLLVTHDPLDAAILADRIVVLEDGAVTQEGRLRDLVARPASPYVAALVGINLLHGVRAGAHTVRLPSGAEVVTAAAIEPDAGDVAVAVRPQAVALHRRRPEGSPRSVWQAAVASVEGDHERVRVRLGGPVPLTAEVTAASVTDLDLAEGRQVWASVKAVDVVVYPR